MYATQPGTKERMGHSYGDLALATATQCFKEVDLDADGNLSFEEFKAWYSSSSSDIAEAATDMVGLEEMRRLTNLGSYSVSDIVELFEASSDDDDLLSREDFQVVYETILATSVKSPE